MIDSAFRSITAGLLSNLVIYWRLQSRDILEELGFPDGESGQGRREKESSKKGRQNVNN